MTLDRPTVAVYDTDGTHLSELPLAAGIQFQHELSAPGSVSFRLPLDDSATALLTPRRIVKVGWRGAPRLAARITGSSTNVAVDGRVWRQWSNLPGILNELSKVPVYPEYGLDRASNSQRTFGYMARNGHSDWLASGNWTAAIGVTWDAMTGARYGLPEGLDYPNPQWIAKRGPNADEAAGSYQWFRRTFNTTATKLVQILATGDNYLELWLDGEKIVDSGTQNQFTWRNAFQISLTLPPSPTGGLHTFAARVRNNRDTASAANHMGLLLTMQEVDTAGNVLEVAPIINSDTNWIVSDIAPGFRKAEVVTRLFVEGRYYGYTICNLLFPDFTRTTDSDGNAWTEAPGEYTLDVGSSLLDALHAFTEKGVDVTVDAATLTLQMWNRYGSDKRSTVAFTRGADDPVNGNLVSHTVDSTAPTFNTVLFQLADGRWMQRQNAAAVTANGREATGLSAGSTSDQATAYAMADAQIADGADPTVTFTTEVSILAGPQVYTDWSLGDTVTVPDETGTGTYPARVMAITVDASQDGPVKVTPELVRDKSTTPATVTAGGAGTGETADLEAP